MAWIGQSLQTRFSTMFGSLVEKLRSVQWLGEVSCIGEVSIMVSQMAMSNLAKTKSGEIVYAQALEFLVDVAAGGVNAKEQQYLLREVHLNAMLALSPEGKDFSAYLEALFCKAKLRNAAGDYTESLEMLENLQRTCDEYGIEYLYAQVLLAINRIRFTAAAPQTPFASLNVLLKSVELCRNHHYDLLLAEAHVVLAEVYIAMGKPQDAYSLINDQMPLVIEHGSLKKQEKVLEIILEGHNEETAKLRSTMESIQQEMEPFQAEMNALRSVIDTTESEIQLVEGL
ncbi:hypothetical protein PsorP6_000539 [Peronosclerospora sorghi]|uniref:Uncharacterized protein n=1 Tax=Peronosclerospora sorghi TaxID=230839 RepID=A0ACC0WSA0_9STRA|nr:hypothetical protein PsorP6_000539 [Peronosclerospora sorghi]